MVHKINLKDIKMKKCPFCSELIQEDAVKCRYCNEWLNKINLKEKVSISTTKISKIIENDVKRAEYGQALYLSTAGKSISAWVFIISGGIIASVVGALITILVMKNTNYRGHHIMLLFFVIGGLLGQLMHKKIKMKLERNP